MKGAIRALRKQHEIGSSARIGQEVAMGIRKADIVVAVRRGTTLLSIELKLSDWKMALAQASLNQLWVDLSYIAVPPISVISEVSRVASAQGIGVIVVKGAQGHVAVAARQSMIVHELRRQKVLAWVSRVD